MLFPNLDLFKNSGFMPTVTSKQIMQSALELSESERSEVATAIIDSLDSCYEEEIDLVAEAQRREQAVDAGTAKYLNESEFLRGIQLG
jgi:hypothetical protein